MTSTERFTSDAPAVAAFVAKWRAREPEMAYAEVFCPRPQRVRFVLWGALLFELREAAFELSDARPTEVKCGWWADEALRCAQDAPRHPLTQALAAPQLPWNAIARGMIAVMQGDESRPVNGNAAMALVAPLANGIATVESELFESVQPDDADAKDATRAVAVHLLGERLRMGIAAGDGGRVPLSLLARHAITGSMLVELQGAPAVRDWAAELAAALPAHLGGSPLFRRTRAAFDGWFLKERATGHDRAAVPALRALRLAWRSARDGRGNP